MANYSYYMPDVMFDRFNKFTQMHCDIDFINSISPKLKPNDEITIIKNSDNKQILRYVFVYRTFDGGFIKKINTPNNTNIFKKLFNKLCRIKEK